MKRGKMDHSGSIRRKILMSLCALVALACIGMLISQWLIQQQGKHANSRMQDLYYSSGLVACAEESPFDMPIAVNEALPRPKVSSAFNKLLEANPDTVGWLHVGDIIDFAVVHRDNEHYLTHNFFNEYAVEGAAFMDAGNSIWPEDTHLIIHGHNMIDGSVFGELKQFRNLEYLQAYPIATFNSLYREHQYVPIAVFDISAEPGYENYMDLQQFRFNNSKAFTDFIADAQQRSYYNIPVDVHPGDHLLSLVTCSYFDVNGRLVVMFRSLRDGESPEQIAALFQNVSVK